MHAYALQKPSSSVTLGEESLGYRLTGKVPFPRAKNRAFGEELTLLVAGRRYSFFFQKKFFPEYNTRGINPLPRAPQPEHSGKKPSSSSAAAQTLGEEILFSEHHSSGTRGKILFRECRSPCTRGSQFENSFFCFSM